jgi:hypothetical protein
MVRRKHFTEKHPAASADVRHPECVKYVMTVSKSFGLSSPASNRRAARFPVAPPLDALTSS